MNSNTPIAVYASHYARAFSRLMLAVRALRPMDAAMMGMRFAEVWERKGDVARRDHYYTEEIHLGTGEIRDI